MAWGDILNRLVRPEGALKPQDLGHEGQVRPGLVIEREPGKLDDGGGLVLQQLDLVVVPFVTVHAIHRERIDRNQVARGVEYLDLLRALDRDDVHVVVGAVGGDVVVPHVQRKRRASTCGWRPRHQWS
ncbi:MAG: hypothetical protein IPK85_03110 [Gemmatimonadetes bacterium]|nr:hypothetical protein [Gemmatimonadota bacterium]